MTIRVLHSDSVDKDSRTILGSISSNDLLEHERSRVREQHRNAHHNVHGSPRRRRQITSANNENNENNFSPHVRTPTTVFPHNGI